MCMCVSLLWGFCAHIWAGEGALSSVAVGRVGLCLLAFLVVRSGRCCSIRACAEPQEGCTPAGFFRVESVRLSCVCYRGFMR